MMGRPASFTWTALWPGRARGAQLELELELELSCELSCELSWSWSADQVAPDPCGRGPGRAGQGWARSRSHRAAGQELSRSKQHRVLSCLTPALNHANLSLWEWSHTQQERHHMTYNRHHTPKHGGKVRHFSMDFFDDSVEGYSLGQSWNGWAVPYFTKAQLEKVIPALNDEYYELGVRWCDKEEDSFEGLPVLRSGHDEEGYPEVEHWNPTRIEGVDEPVWSVGGFSWVWEEFDFPMTETENGWVEVGS